MVKKLLLKAARGRELKQCDIK